MRTSKSGGCHQFLDALPTSPKYFHNALPPAGALALTTIGLGGGVNAPIAASGHLPYIKNKSGNIILFTSQSQSSGPGGSGNPNGLGGKQLSSILQGSNSQNKSSHGLDGSVQHGANNVRNSVQ